MSRLRLPVDVSVDFFCPIAPNDIAPMWAADSWIASSALHKAIRRGDLATALSAALRYRELRGSDIWRRLLVIAFEDVGGANAGALQAASCVARPECRIQLGGDLAALLGAVARMVESVKDRSADHLICAAHSHPLFEDLRASIGNRALEARIETAANIQLPIAERAIAAWFSSGVEWGSERRVGRGDLAMLLTAFAGTGIPDSVLAATAIAARRTQEPITIMAPLLWQAIGDDKHVKQQVIAVPDDHPVKGIPLYALDNHTRLGRHAIKAFSTRNQEIAAALNALVPDFRAHRVAGLAAFYVDAALVSQCLVWGGATEIERVGLEADFVGVGVQPADIPDLLTLFRSHLNELNAIRAELIRGLHG